MAQLTAHGGLDKLVFRDDFPVPVPVPGPRDVLVKVSAAGVNNTDLNTRIGWYSKSHNSNDASWSGSSIVFPRIQGADVCSRVVDAGEVSALVAKTIALTEIAEAQLQFEAKQHIGKFVIDISGEGMA